MQSDKELIEALEGYANDPMWADHAEVHKRFLRQAAARLRALTAEPDEAENGDRFPYWNSLSESKKAEIRQGFRDEEKE